MDCYWDYLSLCVVFGSKFVFWLNFLTDIITCIYTPVICVSIWGYKDVFTLQWFGLSIWDYKDVFTLQRFGWLLGTIVDVFTPSNMGRSIGDVFKPSDLGDYSLLGLAPLALQLQTVETNTSGLDLGWVYNYVKVFCQIIPLTVLLCCCRGCTGLS